MSGALESGGSFLGINEGPSYKISAENRPLSDLFQRQKVQESGAVRDALQKYGLGQMSLEEALNSNAGSDGRARSEVANMLATDPTTGSRFATEQVQSNPLLGQLFGKGGTFERTGQEERDLASRGFQLQPEDIEAYGQTSGDIARLFGQQEQDLSQSLANRGLASAPSGAAGLGFTSLQGNKNEQLARAQMDIANKRMENNLARLGQTRQFLGSLGAQGASAINDQFGRQRAGVQDQRSDLQATAGLQNQYNAGANAATNAAEEFKQKNKPKNFMDYATTGLGQGIQSQMASGTGGIGGGSGFGAFGG